MQGADESSAALMAGSDKLAAATHRYIEDLVEAGVFVATEGLDDAGQGYVVGFTGETRLSRTGPAARPGTVRRVLPLDVASKREAVEWATTFPAVTGFEDRGSAGGRRRRDAAGDRAVGRGTGRGRARRRGLMVTADVEAIWRDRVGEDTSPRWPGSPATSRWPRTRARRRWPTAPYTPEGIQIPREDLVFSGLLPLVIDDVTDEGDRIPVRAGIPRSGGLSGLSGLSKYVRFRLK